MINKTPNARWRVRVKHKGNVVADRVFDRKADAEAWEAEQKRRLALGGTWVDPRRGMEPLATVIARWLAMRESTVAGKTFQTDEYLLRTFMPEHLARQPIASIRSSDIEWNLVDANKRVSLSSVSRYRAVLSGLFQWAVRERVIAENPVADARLPTGKGESERAEIYPFTVGELLSVYADLREAGGRWADLALVLGLTGIRWGELMALRPRDVQSVPYPAIRVSRSGPDGQAIRNVTKGGSTRTVPLPTELLPLFATWLEGKAPNDLIFANSAGNRTGSNNWRRAVNWKENARGRRPHDLRHTAATLWLVNGIDAKTVQKWLGHASMTLTVDTYVHFAGNDADVAAIARVNSLLGDTTGAQSKNPESQASI